MALAGAMSDVSVLLAALVLLLATAAVWLATGHWAPRGQQARTAKMRKCPRVRARGPRRSPGAPVAPRACRPRATPWKHPDGPVNSSSVPCGCGPCLSMAKELQRLLLLLWVPCGISVSPFSGMWQALWVQLQQLWKRGHLPCCASVRCSRRLRPSKSLLPLRLAILGTTSRPLRTFRCGPTVPPRSSGCQRSTTPGASTASDSRQGLKTLPDVDRLPALQNLPITETPPPCEPLPAAPIPAESPRCFKILHLARPVLQSKLLPAFQSFIPGDLDPLQPLGKPFQFMDTKERLDSLSCSLQNQQHPTDIENTGTSQNVDTAREGRGDEMGAKLEPDKHSREQVAEPQVSCSRRCPPQGSRDAVPQPAGDSPSSVAQTVSRRPWRLHGLQEARPRRPPGSKLVFNIMGEPFCDRGT